MEKLVCTACGAPLQIDTNVPFITCEYCDTVVENKFYVAPAVKETEKEAEPAADTVVYEYDGEQAESESGGSLLKTILGVGTAIAANKLRQKTTAARRPVVRTATFGQAAGKIPHQRTHRGTAPRRPEPPHTGGPGMRPARPGSRRPSGGMRGPGMGGMRGPGGRNR